MLNNRSHTFHSSLLWVACALALACSREPQTEPRPESQKAEAHEAVENQAAALQAPAGITCPASCDDGNPCTVDVCGPATRFRCVSRPAANGIACADGDLCNGEERCERGVCRAGKPRVCKDDRNPCTTARCEPDVGCVVENVDDGTLCSVISNCGAPQQQCHAGQCVAEAARCDDQNPCTVDVCKTNGRCTHAPAGRGTSCADANLCNGSEVCDGAGRCRKGAPAPADTECDDGNRCTDTDSCREGRCAGVAKICVASDACHEPGTCDPATGVCANPRSPDGKVCSDGQQCTDADVCLDAVCVGAPVTCSRASCREDLPVAERCPVGDGACEVPRWSTSVPASPVAQDAHASISSAATDQTSLFIAGTFDNSAEILSGHTRISAGGLDAFYAKIDPMTGHATWVKAAGDEVKQLVGRMAANGSGVLASIYESPAETHYLKGISAATGEHLFATPMPSGVRLLAVASNPLNGSFVVCGRRGNVASDVYVARYSAGGERTWDGSGAFAAEGTQVCQTIGMDSSGAAIFASSDARGMFLAKLDGATGSELWRARFVEPGSFAVPQAIAIDDRGDVFLTGSFSGTLTFGSTVLPWHGQEDVFVAKLQGATGLASWSRSFGDPVVSDPTVDPTFSQQAKSIALTRSDEVVVAGVMKGSMIVDATTLTVQGSATSSDGFLLKLAAQDGAGLCARTFGTPNGNDTTFEVLTIRSPSAAGRDTMTVAGHYTERIEFGGAAAALEAGSRMASYLLNLR